MGFAQKPSEPQRRIGRLLVLAAVAAAVSVLALNGSSTPSSGQAVPPQLELELLPPGSLPGKSVRGAFFGAGLGQPLEAQELAVTGRGSRRTALLIARGERGQLCFAVTIGARGRRASFTCLKRWDRAPMLLRVGIGGEARDLTDWFALIGLVRQEVGRVTFDSQRGSTKAVRLRTWSGFPWKTFAVTSRRRGDLPNTVYVRDPSGMVTQEQDLGWVYGSPCRDRHSATRVVGEKTPSKCKGRRRLRAWSDERDPIAAAQAPRINRGAGNRSKRIAVDHPVVRTLVSGQAFSISSVILWTKCKGNGLIGAIVPIRLTKPVAFEGDVPINGYEARSRTAYVEGVAHVKAGGMLSLWAAVDLNRRAVVGIEFFPADFGDASEGAGPRPTIETRIVQQPKPAGGPDSGNCENKGD
jgi:hypothetical protein